MCHHLERQWLGKLYGESYSMSSLWGTEHAISFNFHYAESWSWQLMLRYKKGKLATCRIIASTENSTCYYISPIKNWCLPYLDGDVAMVARMRMVYLRALYICYVKCAVYIRHCPHAHIKSVSIETAWSHRPSAVSIYNTLQLSCHSHGCQQRTVMYTDNNHTYNPWSLTWIASNWESDLQTTVSLFRNYGHHTKLLVGLLKKRCCHKKRLYSSWLALFVIPSLCGYNYHQLVHPQASWVGIQDHSTCNDYASW